MQKFSVTGMTCAACSARVEKAVLAVPGVSSCAVSLLTNSMGVEGSFDDSAIINAVVAAGYGASTQGAKKDVKEQNALLEDVETPILRRRLYFSLILLVPLMYFSMGHMLWDWPLPAFFNDNHVAMGLWQMLLTIAIMIINKKFFISGFTSLIHKSPNMDTLVALGSAASFTWSTLILFAMTRAQVDGNAELVKAYMNDFYFEGAAMIVTLITVGKMLEARSKGQTTNALKSLLLVAPKKATLLRDGVEVAVNVSEVQKGDLFVVRPGENIPVDGVVLEGVTSINEACLTGESIPVDKEPGSFVSAGTQNQTGFVQCRAERVGEDTTLAKIIQLVSDAQATKAPVAKVADRVSGIFVPVIIILALITTCIWLLCGAETGFALARGIAVLVISCPCALGLATPVAIMVGSGLGAKHGILFKTAIALEQVGKAKIIALDKTGTVTSGQPKVTDVLPSTGVTRERLLTVALSLEVKSEHPLAKAIVTYAQEQHITPLEVSNFISVTGSGLTGELDQAQVVAGNLKFIQQTASLPPELLKSAADLALAGKTPLFFAHEAKILGIIAVADTLKADAKDAIATIQAMGLKVVMLTGDNEKTAAAIGHEAGVDHVYANVLPDAKEEIIRALKEQGLVAMVGDGINDAPALTRADVGIAIGAGTDVAIEAADIVLMKSELRDVPAAIRLGQGVLRNIHENLFWAFIYNIIGIPLACGLLYPLFGLKLSPIFAAAAMSLSSFCVVSNALRLNFFDPYKKPKQAKEAPAIIFPELKGLTKDASSKPVSKTNITEVSSNAANDVNNEVSSSYVLKVQGMMCGHCEARVKKALEGLPFVSQATASHEQDTVTLVLSGAFDEEKVRATIVDAGYEYQGYTQAASQTTNTEVSGNAASNISNEVSSGYVLKVQGMMCGHCEARVKKALEGLAFVSQATASHEQGSVTLVLSGTFDEEKVRTTIVDAGYEYQGYEVQ